MKRLTAITVGLLLVWLSTARSTTLAEGEFDDLAAKVPASANAIVLVDAQRLFGSPQAVREDWKTRYDQAFAGGSVTMAPDTLRMILAAQFEYETMQPQWVVAVADFGKARSAVEVARATKGALDPFGGTPAVALRENAYAIELAPTRFAAMSPASRQAVARWLREIQGRTAPAITPFLRETLAASQKSAIVMAFDLEDAVPSEMFRAKLAASAVAKGKKVDLDSAVKVLEGIRGLVLEVAVTEGSFARFLFHFRGDPSVLVPIAKPLVQESLAGLGATLEDIEGWSTESGPQWITLHGPLTAAGRKRIFSLVDNPLAALLAEEPSETAASDRQKSKTIAASQQYFKAMSSVVDDVRTESSKSVTFGQNALWFDKWARRIDALPVLNVDEDLVNFSEFLSTQLRNMAAAMRGIGIHSGARTAAVWHDADDERRAVRTQEKARGAKSARGTAQEIQNVMAKVRKDLTQKYQVEF